MNNLKDTLEVVFQHHTNSVQNNRVAMTLLDFFYKRIRNLEEIFDLKSRISSIPKVVVSESGEHSVNAPDLGQLNVMLNKHFSEIKDGYDNIINNDDKIALQKLTDSSDEYDLEMIKEKFNYLNKLQTKYIMEEFNKYKQTQAQENEQLQVAQTVMDIMKDLVINHNDPQKYFELTE